MCCQRALEYPDCIPSAKKRLENGITVNVDVRLNYKWLIFIPEAILMITEASKNDQYLHVDSSINNSLNPNINDECKQKHMHERKTSDFGSKQPDDGWHVWKSISNNKRNSEKHSILYKYLFYNIITFMNNTFISVANINYIGRILYNEKSRSKSSNYWLSGFGYIDQMFSACAQEWEYCS